MVDEKILARRRKPNFLRKDWHKKIRLGSTVRKKRKWRAARGRHNKIRLSRKGHLVRPKIGWGSKKSKKRIFMDSLAIRIENLEDLNSINKNQGIIIAKVGRKKRNSIIKKANEMKIRILNKYKSVLEKEEK